ncbi:MAG: DNA integrity scanning protein DisA nucleotide-binding domain protein [Thermodesulfovibrionales bacterium]
MDNQAISLIRKARDLADEAGCDALLLFLNTRKAFRWFSRSAFAADHRFIVVIPRGINPVAPRSGSRARALKSWAGNQSRFSRIKYAFLHGVRSGVILPDSRIVCILGPWGKEHLDTITIHDLAHSWSEDFPFDPRSLMDQSSFVTVMAVVDIALDIGALGREGSPIGTSFIIGDTANVLASSHQAVFNPFKGYPKAERDITRPGVVESIKELAKLDGAFVVSGHGIVEAAGRHLDARSMLTRELRGFGSRHRAAAGITKTTQAVAVVVSESTGRVTLFERGKIIASLEPVISRRLV